MKQYTYPDILLTADGWLIIAEGSAPTQTEKEFTVEYTSSPTSALRELGLHGSFITGSPELRFLYDFSHGFAVRFALELPTEEESFVYPEPDDESAFIKSAEGLSGGRNITPEWLSNESKKLFRAYVSAISATKSDTCDYLMNKNPDLNFRGKIYFNILENPGGRLPFAFEANVFTVDNGKVKRLSLLRAVRNARAEGSLYPYLAPLLQAEKKSALISGMESSGELLRPVELSAERALALLKETPLFTECGIICRVPDWWKKTVRKPKLRVSVGGDSSGRLGLNSITEFDAGIELDGRKLTAEEIKAIEAASDTLLNINGSWIEADGNEYKELITAFRAAKKLFENKKYTFAEAMRICLGLYDSDIAKILQPIQENDRGDRLIGFTDWLSGLDNKLSNNFTYKEIPASPSFTAVLRPYQIKGFNWLYYMHKTGFGACLSDDMGLGKTVELLALLDRLKADGEGPSLLVIPASLAENWKKEAAKFAPALRIKILHRSYDGNDITDDGTDLYITTYAMAARNTALKERKWVTLTLDEAQAIKNPAAKQSKAVKALQADTRIIMTGTPIENRFSDLWSLFDFINPGMLGTSGQFSDKLKSSGREEFSRRLASVTSPFILRRLKTDKSIIPDLPDKIEMKAYPSLTRRQALIYKACVDTLAAELAKKSNDGIARKGLILTTLLRLKQICDHPDLYEHKDTYEASDSGKFAVLSELCETIRERGEKVLVFTQFAELCRPLARFLEKLFGARGFVLTGDTPVKTRGEYTDSFNADEKIPFTVLSIKAGGVGLNLTGANHVIHFDRWWNPAVENQATDRAFRIGQKKNVIVHKLIAHGTVEEKIDMLIEDKKSLAANILSSDSAESIITGMSPSELIALFRQEKD